MSTAPADRLHQAETRLRNLPEPAASNLAALFGVAFTRRLADWVRLEADLINARIADGSDPEYAVDIAADHALLLAESILNPTAPSAFQQQLGVRA